jgi:hypothetical protein
LGREGKGRDDCVVVVVANKEDAQKKMGIREKRRRKGGGFEQQIGSPKGNWANHCERKVGEIAPFPIGRKHFVGLFVFLCYFRMASSSSPGV